MDSERYLPRVDPELARQSLTAHRLHKEGYSIRMISKYLQALGVKSAQGGVFDDGEIMDLMRLGKRIDPHE